MLISVLVELVESVCPHCYKLSSSTINTPALRTLQPNLHPAKLISGINGLEWIYGGTDTDIENIDTDSDE